MSHTVQCLGSRCSAAIANLQVARHFLPSLETNMEHDVSFLTGHMWQFFQDRGTPI